MRFTILRSALLISASLAYAADNSRNRTEKTEQTGIASFYSTRMDGRITASGQRFNNRSLTAAHRELPLGTRLRLTNTTNGRSVVVHVNDRGPFVKGREISVTRQAARQLGFIKAGTAAVKIVPVS